MCLAIPGKIIAITDQLDETFRKGKVSFGGIMKEVSLYMVPEAQVGDYVLVHVGVAINVVDEEIVWHALTITSCLDFVKRENITNELKWIHTKNTGLSGGQKGRISIARAIYRIITTKPKFITLDEVDRAIQSELVVDIMKNIYKYARKNNILVFVICHNPDVKKLDEYNQTIRFVKGMIKKI